MATPKLALIPTGYKAGKLYSVLPESGVGDFTVVRATEATRVNEEGLIETMGANVPRLDYSGGGCPVLLTEPQRTNLITYSEDFSQWTDAGTTTVLSNITNPSGGLQSYLLSASSSATNALRYDDSFSASTNYSYSLFLKAGTSQEVRMQIYDGSSFFRLAVNPLNNFEIVDQSGVNSYLIEDFTNGWKKVSINITTSASASSGYLQIYPDRTGNLNNVYIYGVQLEIGSYPSSLINTSGSAVTRNADQVYGAGDAATFNDSEGVLMVESATLVEGEDVRIIGLSDGSTNNRISITYHSTENRIQIYGSKNGAIFNLEYLNAIKTDYNKIAIKYNASSVDFYYNGFLVDTEVPSDMFDANTLNSLNFDRIDNNNNFYGNTKQVQYFNTALTDSELETLTSWTSFIEMAQALNYNII